MTQWRGCQASVVGRDRRGEPRGRGWRPPCRGTGSVSTRSAWVGGFDRRCVFEVARRPPSSARGRVLPHRVAVLRRSTASATVQEVSRSRGGVRCQLAASLAAALTGAGSAFVDLRRPSRGWRPESAWRHRWRLIDRRRRPPSVSPAGTGWGRCAQASEAGQGWVKPRSELPRRSCRRRTRTAGHGRGTAPSHSESLHISTAMSLMSAPRQLATTSRMAARRCRFRVGGRWQGFPPSMLRLPGRRGRRRRRRGMLLTRRRCRRL